MVPFLTAFLIPVFLLLLFNLVIFIIIIIVVVKHNKEKNERLGKSSMTTKEVLKMMVPLTGIMLLFGLTWVFAVFTFISEPGVSYTVQFLFAFFNAFQGFFIFLFFVIISSESRDAWKAYFCHWNKATSTNANFKTVNKKTHTINLKSNVSSAIRLTSLNETANNVSVDSTSTGKRSNNISVQEVEEMLPELNGNIN